MFGPSSRVFLYKIHDFYEIKMSVERSGSLYSEALRIGHLRSSLFIICTSPVKTSSAGL